MNWGKPLTQHYKKPAVALVDPLQHFPSVGGTSCLHYFCSIVLCTQGTRMALWLKCGLFCLGILVIAMLWCCRKLSFNRAAFVSNIWRTRVSMQIGKRDYQRSEKGHPVRQDTRADNMSGKGKTANLPN